MAGACATSFPWMRPAGKVEDGKRLGFQECRVSRGQRGVGVGSVDDDRSTASHLRRTTTVRWADDRWGYPPVRIDVGGWEVGGRWPRGPDADVRCPPRPKPDTYLRSKWVRPETKWTRWVRAVARWAVWFVPFIPNGRGRTKWGCAVELA